MKIITKPGNVRSPYTVRYRLDGKQREKSFRTRQLAKDFAAQVAYESRAGTFVDPKLAGERFSLAAERWVSRLTGAGATKTSYRRVLKNHINPAIGNWPLRKVATDRHAIETLLRETMPAAGLGPSQVRTGYVVIRAVVNDALKAGKLTVSRLNGIKLPAVTERVEIYFPSHDQLVKLAEGLPEPYGLTVWLMRACGLRIGEVLALKRSDFMNGTLRVQRQRLTDGSDAPLKARKPGQFRDVPVPGYAAKMVASSALNATDGYLFPTMKNRRVYDRWFATARDAAGLPATFTPHSLRHVYASVALSEGLPISDVSKWLGHASITITVNLYGHIAPPAWDRARDVLDREFASWSAAGERLAA